MSRLIVLLVLAIGFFATFFVKGLIVAFLMLALIISLITLVRERRYSPSEGWRALFIRPEIFLFLIMIVLWGLSALWGIKPAYSFKKWFDTAFIMVEAFIIYRFLCPVSPQDIRRFHAVFYGLSGVFAVWALVDTLNILPSFTELVHGTDFFIAFYTTIMAFAFFIALAYALTSERHPRIAMVVPFLVAVAAIALGARSGWVGLWAGILVFFLFMPWRILQKPLQKALLSAVILVAGMAGGLWAYQYQIGEEYFVKRVTMNVERGAEGLGSGRLPIWHYSLEKWREKPWLGIGPKAFRKLDFEGVTLNSRYHPHNAIIEILLETGILGLLSAMVLLGYMLIHHAATLWQLRHRSIAPREQVLYVAAYASVIAFCVSALVHTSVFHAWWQACFLILLILTYTMKRVCLSMASTEKIKGEARAHTATR